MGNRNISIEVDDGLLPWEYEAKARLERAVYSHKLSPKHGAITVRLGLDANGDDIWKKFETIVSLREALSELAEDGWDEYAPRDTGQPVFDTDIESYVDEALEEMDARKFYAKHGRAGTPKQLFALDDLLTPAGRRTLRIEVQNINEELVRYFAKHPEKMRDMKPRKFEELVAELFRDQGYEVELTQISRDGGFDIRAVRKTKVGLGLTLIECKRYSKDRRVGVPVIRALYGCVEKERASEGLLITTTYFSKDAKDYQEDLKYRLSLADFDKLKDLLAGYKRGRR